MLNRREFIKASTAAAAGTIATSSSMNAPFKKAKISNIGMQLWSIAKSLEKDFTGSLHMLSQIGYKDLELFGPYPFSFVKDKVSWNTITSMVGFSQSGYFNHTPKQLKEILDSKGLRNTGHACRIGYFAP